MMLDFNDNYHMKKFMRRDKHDLLEGIVVEELFMDDIVLPSGWKPWISKGWWAIKDPLKRSNYLLFHVTNFLPHESDLNIYRILIQSSIPIIHVLLHNNNLYFLEINEGTLLNPITLNDYIHEYVFLSNYNLIKTQKIHLTEKKYRDSFLQDRAITFFEKRNILREVALQRYFGNYFLTVNFNEKPVNLDYFMNFNDGLTVLEIKFKYPSLDGHYGINIGEANLFKWLIDSNIRIMHFIAKNPSNSKQLGIFEVLATPSLKDRLFWQSHFLNKNELSANKLTASEETSITGRQSQNYIPIPSNTFVNVSLVAGGLDVSTIPKIICSVCKTEKKAINGRNGYFMGCPNYNDGNH